MKKKSVRQEKQEKRTISPRPTSPRKRAKFLPLVAPGRGFSGGPRVIKHDIEKPVVTRQTRYSREDHKFFQDLVLEVMSLGRSFNGAVAWCCKTYSNEERTPERTTFYRWLKENLVWREQVEAAAEDNYGRYEEAEKLMVEGGFVTGETTTEEYYAPRNKAEEQGPLKRRKKVVSHAAPSAQALLKGLDRRARHILRCQRADNEKERLKVLSEVPSPSELVFSDAEGNEIPLVPQVVFLIESPKQPQKQSQKQPPNPGKTILKNNNKNKKKK